MDGNGAFAPFRITVCGIPELDTHCSVGVSHVLSILDPGYPEPAAFEAYGEHERLELHFDDIIDEQPGKVPPQPAHVESLLSFGQDILREGRMDAHLLVHCHAGVSRSTASMLLLLAQARPDRTAEEALSEVVRIRPQAWPNLRLVEIGDTLLGRKGELVEVAHRRYRELALRRPELVRFMMENGRRREVPPDLWEV